MQKKRDNSLTSFLLHFDSDQLEKVTITTKAGKTQKRKKNKDQGKLLLLTKKLVNGSEAVLCEKTLRMGFLTMFFSEKTMFFVKSIVFLKFRVAKKILSLFL